MFSRRETLQQTFFDRSWVLMAKAAKLSFVPPFGGLRGNVHGSSVARRKVRGRLLIIVNWTFFASSHGWGTMSGYWSNLWCCKGGVSLWVLILGGRGSSTNDSWRKNTKSPCAITWWCLRDPTFSRFDTILVLTHPLGGLLIGAWSGHVIHYKILGLQSYHRNGFT